MLPDSPLVLLFRQRKWQEVIERIQKNPSEVSASEAAQRGERPTVLAMALRIGAPIQVIEAIAQCDRQQLVICHRFAGSIVHEALRYLACDQVFNFVFREAMEQQEYTKKGRQSSLSGLPATSFSSQFQCVHVQENRVVQAPNLLEVQDDLGRTVLHHVVEQIQRRKIILGSKAGSSFSMFQQLIEAHSGLVHMTDSDGNTPLVLLLSQHHDNPDPDLEQEIFQMVEYLTTNYPSTVAYNRQPTRMWRFMNYFRIQPTALRVSPVASPLYFAILYGRSEATIRALLHAHNAIGDNGCATIVTQYCEFCLHVAVTLRAPIGILKLLVDTFPDAVQGADVYGLTPLDWLWITYVVDWYDQGDHIHRRLSRRRHLGREFREWHELVTDRIPYQVDRYDGISQFMVDRKQRDLIARLRVLLPVSDDSSLLHRVSQLVNLPFGILKLVLSEDPNAYEDLRRQDKSGRCPLHHIVGHCRGYRVSLPLGVTSRVEILAENKETLAVSELVDQFPAACTIFDNNGQLPLHIAIDAFKKNNSPCDNGFADTILQTLVKAYPESLGKRDGMSQLYPWQQAAVGPEAHLGTIFQLLRKEPIFLAT